MLYDKIIWKKEYHLNIAEIDQQRLKLVALINELLDINYQEEDFKKLKKALFEVVEYTNYHFEAESSLHKKLNYGHYHEHKAQHQMLVKQIVELLQSLKRGKTEFRDDLPEILENWFIRYVINHDKEFDHFVEENNPKLIAKL